MKIIGRNLSLAVFLAAIMFFTSCKTWSNAEKGAAIGVGAGAAAGAVIGRASGNTALGTIIGATVGGTAGVLIGRKMDKQAERIQEKVPDAKVDRVGEGILVEMNDKVLFDFDKSDLTSTAKTNLNKMVVVFQEYPDTYIEIQGHTDDVGTETYNKSLSKRRATSVYSYLSSKGVSSGRMATRAYGEMAPAYTNDTPDNQARNRRVDFLIIANNKMKADAKREAGE